jgi:peptidoglycan hydrolase-like protein with peptidoglycan-binding domain
VTKIWLSTASLLSITICTIALGQVHHSTAPKGTVIEKRHPDGSTEVQPEFKKIRVTPDVIRAAQQKLSSDGYETGTADGKVGPLTRAAIRKYQNDKNLKVSGELDESTLSHLDVGAGKTIATAPSALGSGTKAAGHDIKEGHPLAAAKAFGKGVGHASKSVAEGTKSGVMGTKDKVAGNKNKPDESKQPPR